MIGGGTALCFSDRLGQHKLKIGRRFHISRSAAHYGLPTGMVAHIEKAWLSKKRTRKRAASMLLIPVLMTAIFIFPCQPPGSVSAKSLLGRLFPRARAAIQPYGSSRHSADGSHRTIDLRPPVWQAAEAKEAWLCQCKQTKNPPNCDGTHEKLGMLPTFRDSQHGQPGSVPGFPGAKRPWEVSKWKRICMRCAFDSGLRQ